MACDAAALLSLRGEAAWEAYRGPFLRGVNLPDVSGEFEEWVLAQRERLARHVQDEALRVAEGSEPGLAAVWAQGWFTARAPEDPAVDAEQRAGPERAAEGRVHAGVTVTFRLAHGGPLDGRNGQVLEQVVVEVHGCLQGGRGGAGGLLVFRVPAGALRGRYAAPPDAPDWRG